VSRPVDVREKIRAACDADVLPYEVYHAVDELIEAAQVFANDDRQHAWHPSYRPKMDALHAAIARVGGAR